jgi:hypothetical protein
VRTDNLTSEGSLAGIKVRGQVLGQLNKVNIRNQNFGDGTLPDFDFGTTDLLYVSEYENRGSTGNAGSTKLIIRNDRAQFGAITIHGGVPGHGVVLDPGVNYVSIANLYVHDLRGNAADGTPSAAFWSGTTAVFNYIGIAMLIDNEIGWKNEATAEIIINTGRIVTNKTTYPSTVELVGVTSLPVTALRKCGFSTNDGSTSKFATYVGTVAVDPTLTTEQTLTFTHTLWRTPALTEVAWNYLTNGTTRPTLAYAEVSAVTATTITMRVKFAVAGNGTSGGSAFHVMV